MSAILRLTNGCSSQTKFVVVTAGGVPPQQYTTPIAPGSSHDFDVPAGARGMATGNLDDGTGVMSGPLSFGADGEVTEATLA